MIYFSFHAQDSTRAQIKRSQAVQIRVNQALDQSRSRRNQAAIQPPNLPFNQTPNQPFNQSPNQPSNQVPNQPFNNLSNHPFNQSPVQPFNQPPNQPFNQPFNQPSNPSTILSASDIETLRYIFLLYKILNLEKRRVGIRTEPCIMYNIH